MIIKEEYKIINKKKNLYEHPRSLIIEALKIAQIKYGWVPNKEIVYIAKILSLSVSEVESVATFYSKIFRKPVGKNIIYYCDSVVCYLHNADSIRKNIELILNIKLGQTTKNNKFTFLPTSCLGRCDYSPIIMVNYDIYTKILKKDIINIINKYL
ncbi:MAG: NADH-quinone oxidoreductase subunit NuoE [Candidatus Lightella neohaematopini]|nr:NADH-quinone oxidoreductase subunit NuoE [Candidatus Lightella neohaematopini]MCV2528667.1 NADH-quinone oxidoreductase subunit NuoE [Candidatus Lightella neohaematopini]